MDYDCLIYVANWPEARKEAWNSLLRARAHENQCYVVGLNRVGMDGNKIFYSGDSCIINPKGLTISLLNPEEEISYNGKLSRAELLEFRTKFPIALDADDFNIV